MRWSEPDEGIAVASAASRVLGAEIGASGGIIGFTANDETETKHMKRYKVIRIIGVVLLVLSAAMITIAIMEGKKSILQSIGTAGGLIAVGGALCGMSLLASV